MAEEVREREEIQVRLRESQERYALVEDAVNDGIWDANLITGKHYRSPRWKAILGYADDDVSAAAEVFIDLIHPEDRGPVENSIRAHVENGAPHDLDFRLRCKNGDYLWVHGRGRALRDETGRPVRMLGTISDISERRRTADMLAQAHKMEAVGQLTAGIAHDFNNLLAVIGGGLEFVSEAAGRGLTAEPELIEAALRATRRGAELVGRLLAFSRQSPLKIEATNVDQMVLETLRLLKRTLGEQVEIETRLDTNAAELAIDRGQMVNVLLNLAVNARDAMPEGGRLSIETRCRPARRIVTEGAARWPTGDEVQMIVRDTGMGMSAEVRRRAFEPFFTTKDMGAGAGLGLSMVLGSVEQVGGYVELESTEGEGTIVTISLPRTHALGPQDSNTAGSDLVEEAREKTVLLVEDDPDVRIVTEAQLKRLGYKVHAVATGMEAIDVIASPAIVDLLLTDIVMPGGVDGMTLLKEAIRARPGMGVLCMSGYDPSKNHRKWLQMQNIEFLQKPFSTSKLERALRATAAR